METFGSYWGLCPECKAEPEMLNIERDHWAFCPTHKFKWYIGGNLFSDWHGENESIWSKNREMLAEFVEVKPYYPDDQTDDRPELDLEEARERWHDHLTEFVEDAPNPAAAVALTLNSALILALEVCGREWTEQQLRAAIENVALYDAKPTRLV